MGPLDLGYLMGHLSFKCPLPYPAIWLAVLDGYWTLIQTLTGPQWEGITIYGNLVKIAE